jgi:Fe2+ or Zn2+ uptake regulation protein
LRWRILDKAYDTSLTVEENLSNLNDEVMEISLPTIYRYLQDRGIVKKKSGDVKYERFCILHREGLSLRKERELLKSYGLVLAVRTISEYRKRIQVQPNGS